MQKSPVVHEKDSTFDPLTDRGRGFSLDECTQRGVVDLAHSGVPSQSILTVFRW